MSLPIAWIDKIFKKMTLNYGVEFVARYKGQKINDVKTDWSHELSGFDSMAYAIAFGLSNLPDRVPTAQQFKTLCRQAPSKQIALPPPSPKADPDRVAAELAKLAPVRNAPKIDSIDWARSILANPNGRTPTVIQMAKTAVNE